MTADGPKTEKSLRFSAHRREVREGRLVQLAARQHGVIGLWQLEKLGLAGETARMRVGGGRFHRVHQGAYSVGCPPMTQRSHLMAAVLACGPDAVLSHRSAAALWGMCEDRRVLIDVTAPNRRGRSPAGICAHRDSSLRPEDRDEVDGIPCTSVARTLLDFAGAAPVGELQRALAEAEVKRIVDLEAVRLVIERSAGRRGVARLRTLIDDFDLATRYTRSELERRFLLLCRKAGLPGPEVNVLLDLGNVRFRPDFLWRDARLIVETDGHHFHATHSARESDTRREQRLQLAGWRVSRCTWAQVVHEPRRLAATIRGFLAQV